MKGSVVQQILYNEGLSIIDTPERETFSRDRWNIFKAYLENIGLETSDDHVIEELYEELGYSEDFYIFYDWKLTYSI